MCSTFSIASRADPPVISRTRKKQFFHDVGRVIGIKPKPNKRAALRSAAFEWMRSVLKKEITDDALRREIGDLPDLNRLLRRLYEGRLSDRNRHWSFWKPTRSEQPNDLQFSRYRQ